MIARKITENEMVEALKRVNEKYEGNVIFNRFEVNGKAIHFTLRVQSSRGPGHRLSHQHRRLVSACWHVHGDFFDAALAVQPNAVFISRGGPGARIDCNGGNWQDCNIGSMMYPMMYSEACEC